MLVFENRLLGKVSDFFLFIYHTITKPIDSIINNPIYLRSEGISINIPINYPPKQG